MPNTTEFLFTDGKLVLQIPNTKLNNIFNYLESIWHATGVDGHQPYFDYPEQIPAQSDPSSTLVILGSCQDINEILTILMDAEAINMQQAKLLSPSFQVPAKNVDAPKPKK